MTKEFTCYTHLAKNLPKKFLILTQKNHFSNRKNRFSTQRKNFLYSPPKNQFFKRKNFSHPFQRTVHLVHSAGPPKKENSTQNVFYTYPKKQFSKRKNFLHPLERTDFLPKENIYLFAPQKTNFSNEKVFHARFKETFTWYNHMTHPKKENSTQKISYT